MITKIIIAGAGGQGIMLLGKVIATAAMKENKFVTWLPAYGAEVRGGTANCAVIISDQPIGLPYIEQADFLLVMNEPSLLKFKGRVKKRGIIIVNNSLAKVSPIQHIRILEGPFTQTALEIGNIKTANMAALGFLLAHESIVGLKTVLAVIQEMAPAGKLDLVEINRKAVEEGIKLKDLQKKNA